MNQGADGRNNPAPFCENQNAQQAKPRNTQISGDGSATMFIHLQHIRARLYGQSDRFGLATVQLQAEG